MDERNLTPEEFRLLLEKVVNLVKAAKQRLSNTIANSVFLGELAHISGNDGRLFFNLDF